MVGSGAGDEAAAPLVERRGPNLVAIRFMAMASPCEVLLATGDLDVARGVGGIAAAEAMRIERKFSRYRPDSVVTRLNGCAGRPIEVDEETAALLSFAAHCHALSDGRFDVTSGVLRRAWRFDGSDRLPDPAAVALLLPLIGFDKVLWAPPLVTVPVGMEIDFGGIGKEYAVDRVLGLVQAAFDGPALVNFGGDLATNRAPETGPWRVGIERPGSDREAALLLELSQGALATSGDTHRYLVRDGVRYGHIMDVRTGWPVPAAPASITVAAASCVEAGMLATMSMLQGVGAEAFLDEQGVRYWCLRA
jgi:thiamine biosynthesis lipoprotein